MRLRAREQLRAGASQIKLMAGGGVASPYNPIEFTQFTEPEIRAAVEATENWGTYVTVHVKMATAYNGELMALTGFINPYSGKLGVGEQGGLADLLLVDVNPLGKTSSSSKTRTKTFSSS